MCLEVMNEGLASCCLLLLGASGQFCAPSGLTGRFANWTRSRRLQELRPSKPFSNLMMSSMPEALCSQVASVLYWSVNCCQHGQRANRHHCFLGSWQLLLVATDSTKQAVILVKLRFQPRQMIQAKNQLAMLHARHAHCFQVLVQSSRIQIWVMIPVSTLMG